MEWGSFIKRRGKLIDMGLNIIMPGLSGHIPFLFFLSFSKCILLRFTGLAAKTVGINKKAGA